jgi:acyl carrier protein
MEEFLQFAAKVLKVDRQFLSPDTAYGAIPQWDSIMHLRLVMEIEEKYNIEIPMDEVPRIKKLSQFNDYFKKA